MVNSKKMSKSSIAVIVLSILLVLSMILGLTGAWFTDTSNDESNGTLDWGAVRVQAALDENVTVSTADTSGKVLPGDSVSVEGTVKFVDATVDMYMLLEVSSEGAVAGYITISDLELSGLTALENITGIAANHKLYKVTVAQAAGTYNLAGSIDISEELPNKIDSTQYNGGSSTAVKFGVKVSVIQAAHIATPDAAYNLLKAGVPVYND